MDYDTLQWWLGNVLSLLACIGLSVDYGFIVGGSVAFALMLLVDIRYQTSGAIARQALDPRND